MRDYGIGSRFEKENVTGWRIRSTCEGRLQRALGKGGIIRVQLAR